MSTISWCVWSIRSSPSSFQPTGAGRAQGKSVGLVNCWRFFHHGLDCVARAARSALSEIRNPGKAGCCPSDGGIQASKGSFISPRSRRVSTRIGGPSSSTSATVARAARRRRRLGQRSQACTCATLSVSDCTHSDRRLAFQRAELRNHRQVIGLLFGGSGNCVCVCEVAGGGCDGLDQGRGCCTRPASAGCCASSSGVFPPRFQWPRRNRLLCEVGAYRGLLGDHTSVASAVVGSAAGPISPRARRSRPANGHPGCDARARHAARTNARSPLLSPESAVADGSSVPAALHLRHWRYDAFATSAPAPALAALAPAFRLCRPFCRTRCLGRAVDVQFDRPLSLSARRLDAVVRLVFAATVAAFATALPSLAICGLRHVHRGLRSLQRRPRQRARPGVRRCNSTGRSPRSASTVAFRHRGPSNRPRAAFAAAGLRSPDDAHGCRSHRCCCRRDTEQSLLSQAKPVSGAGAAGARRRFRRQVPVPALPVQRPELARVGQLTPLITGSIALVRPGCGA